MSDIERKMHIYSLLRENPAWIDILSEAIEIQDKKVADGRTPDFEWYEVHGSSATLRNMVAERVLDVTLHTRKSTWYQVRDPDLVKETIGIIKKRGDEEREEAAEDIDVHSMFRHIVGYDTFKYIIKRAVESKEPVHVLLYGPPATAKTLFLEELSKLPRSRYILGSAMSKAGIVDFLLEGKPKYLIIDEIEKASGKDLSSLLSLMQTGIVSRLKKNMREQAHLKTWVFAGANEIKKMPIELLSRFVRLQFKEYSAAGFKQVAREILKDEKVDEDLSEYIVSSVAKYSRDVRDVIKIVRLSKSKDEVDYITNTLYRA